MADTTISQLSLGIPSGSNSLPYTTGSETKRTLISSITANCQQFYPPPTDTFFSNVQLLIKKGVLYDLSSFNRTFHYISNPSIRGMKAGWPSIDRSFISKSGNTPSNFQISSTYAQMYGSKTNLAAFNLGQAAWTVEFWIFIPSWESGSYGHTFNLGGQDSNGTIKFWNGDYKIYLFSSTGQSVNSTNGLVRDVWNHVVFERYNNVIYCWVNGINRNSGTIMPPGGTPLNIAIGQGLNNEYYEHYIDELRFTNISRYQGTLTIPVQTVSWPEQ